MKSNKQFRNKIAVKGSKNLLKAFSQELNSLGYKFVGKDDADNYKDFAGDRCDPIYLTTNGLHVPCKNGEYLFALNNGGQSSEIYYNLPEEYNEALKAASEVEEEVFIEYYKYIKPSSASFTEGKIYKCNNPRNLEASENFIDDIGRLNGFCGTNHTMFVPSSKSEYDAQELEYKKQELLQRAIKEYPIGTEFEVPEWDSGKTLKGTVNRTPHWKNNGYEDIIGCGNGIIYSNKYGWSKIIKEEFKVGDYLYFNGNSSTNAPKGSIAIVTESIHLSKSHNCDYVGIKWISRGNTNQSDGNYYPKDFRLATPEEIAKVKEDTIEIAGYKAEVKDYQIAFGCKKFTEMELRAIKKVIEISEKTGLNFNFESGEDLQLTYDGNSYDISSKEIQTLIDKISSF